MSRQQHTDGARDASRPRTLQHVHLQLAPCVLFDAQEEKEEERNTAALSGPCVVSHAMLALHMVLYHQREGWGPGTESGMHETAASD